MRAMGMAPPGEMPWGEFALRFTLSVPGVASAIVGTGRLAHLLENVAWASKGPLDAALVAEWRQCFREHDRDWRGQV
jgi:aryl-alcohol dehydrogenase-like predicted oxidoreductase